MSFRFIEMTPVFIDQCQIAVRPGEVRVRLDCPLEGRDGQLEPPLVPVNQPEVVVAFGVILVDADDLLELTNRLVASPLLVVENP